MMAEASANKDPWAINCILCKQFMKDTDKIAVKIQGIKNFIKSSKLRNDQQVAIVLRGKDSITVHNSCSKTYNSKVALKKFAVSPAQANTLTRSKSVQFDFENNCIVCGDGLRRKKDATSNVSYVTDVALKNRLLQKFANVDDPKAKEFVNRISLVPCLVEAEAGYHRKCMMKPKFTPKSTKISDDSGPSVFNITINYISSKPDQAQFCLTDIISDTENCENIEMPNLPRLKYKLQDKLGSDFLLQISDGDIIISRLSLARSLLLKHFDSNKKNRSIPEQSTPSKRPKLT